MKSISWTPETGEDAGNTFVITRMSAFTADKWARNLVQALTRAGCRLPDTALSGGITGIAGIAMSLFGELDEKDADRAFAGLRECVKVRPRGMPPNANPRNLIEQDLQDPQTLQTLYGKSFGLHVDFLKASASLISPLAQALMPPQTEDDAPKS